MPLFNVLQTLGISETNMLEGHCLFSMFQTLSEKSSSAACQIFLYHHTPLLIQCSPFQALTGKNSITAVQLLLIKIAWNL